MTIRETEPPGEDQLDPPPGPIAQPRLGVLGWLRWAWRQLTSMRSALLLLMLLAVAAIPGSIVPQNRIDPTQVDSWKLDHPGLTPWIERVDGFDIYGSPWFSAIYLLLFISLVGCVLPRSRQHWKAMRSQPPRAPRRLERLPFHASRATGAEPDVALERARKVLRRRRFRIGGEEGSVAAERGHLAETGNLMFHLALLGLLITMAVGSFVTYSGQSSVTEKQGWANNLLYYDSFTSGRGVDPGHLSPFSLTLDRLQADFRDSAAGFGSPSNFTAYVSVRESPGDRPVRRTIRVNHPLTIGGANVYLAGNGYAPVLTVRDGRGEIVSQGPQPFYPIDANYTSTGVVKILDGLTGKDGKPIQVGLQGQFLPTAVQQPGQMPVNVFPDAKNPLLLFTGWAGDLGTDSGVPQNVNRLNVKAARQLTVDGKIYTASLTRGGTVQLPDDLGSVTFDGVQRFAAFEVRSDPTKVWVLVAAVLALTGLTLSLFVRRRRVWVRAERQSDGRTLVRVAGLPRRAGDDIGPEVAAILDELVPEVPEEREEPT